MDVNIARFAGEAAPLINDWKSIDLRVVASRSGDRWVYGAIKAILDSSDPSVLTRKDLPSIEGFLVAHERLDIKNLPNLLESLSSHHLDVQGRSILVENANTNPSMNYSFEVWNRRDAIQRLGIGSYALYLQSWSGQPMIEGDLRLSLDTRLRLGQYPWDGITDLLTNFVGVSPNYSRSMPTKLVEVIAPVSLWIKDAIVDESGEVHINVEKSPSLSEPDIGLSSIAYIAGENQTRLRKAERSVADDTHLSFKLKYPTEVQQITSILTYHQLDVDKMEVFGKSPKGINPRLAILWTDTLDEFAASLRDEKDKFFDDRVSILFHVLGLSPGYYARAYQDNADIVVFPNSGDWVLNIECTTREIDLHDKLSKLATRTKVLTASMVGITVHSVLVTRYPRVLVNETEKDKARTENISIVTADEFDTFIRMAIEEVESVKVRDYILSLIPGTGRGVTWT